MFFRDHSESAPAPLNRVALVALVVFLTFIGIMLLVGSTNTFNAAPSLNEPAPAGVYSRP